MELEQLHEIVGTVATVCLTQLVKDGYTTAATLNGRWEPRPDLGGRLERARFAAAVTFDDASQRAILLYSLKLPLAAVLYAIPHEVVHVAQTCNGHLMQEVGYSTWQGRRYEALAAEDPRYSIDQPWEAEACAREGALREYMYQRFPLWQPGNKSGRS
jgi:hypothetical protein